MSDQDNTIRPSHSGFPVPQAVKDEQPKSPLATAEFVMRVKGDSNVHKVASAISHALNAYRSVALRTLGAGPNQQALKAIAVASGRERTAGYDLSVRVAMFDEAQPDGSMLTIMCLKLVRERV